MLLLSALNNRQLGLTRRKDLVASTFQLSLDNLLSKLVCVQDNVFDSHGEMEIPVPPFSCKFRKDHDLDLLAVATEEGNVLLIDTEYGKGVVKSFLAHHNAIFDVCWLTDKNRLITGAGDFSCRLFDVDTCKLVSSFKCHTASVRSVDVCKNEDGNAIFCSGSRDGNISVWDIREPSGAKEDKPAILIKSAHSIKNKIQNSKRNSVSSSDHCKSSVSAVAFQDEHTLASVGVADGLVKVWDLRKTYVDNPSRLHRPRYQIKYSNEKNSHGCTSLVFDSLHKKLFCCGTANLIYQFDFHSYSSEVITYSGFKCNSYYVKLDISPDDQYLVCGSSDNKAYIWKTSLPGSPILELPGHSAEVTSVAWSPYNPTKLITSGDDNKIFLWNVKNSEGKIHVNDENIEASAKVISNEDMSPSKQAVQSTQPQRSISFPPLKMETAPSMRSITSFFSPVAQNSSQTVRDSDSLQTTSPIPSHLSPDKSATPVASNQLRSPCKLRNNCELPMPGMTTPSPTKSSPHGKENSIVKMVTLDSSSASKSNGQSKRKASEMNRICRYHPRGCGRTRGHTRCGKKIVILPSTHNIKSYFSPVSGE